MGIAAAKARINLRNIIVIFNLKNINVNLCAITAFCNKTGDQTKKCVIFKRNGLVSFPRAHSKLFLCKNGDDLSGEHVDINICTDFLAFKKLLNYHIRLMGKEKLYSF